MEQLKDVKYSDLDAYNGITENQIDLINIKVDRTITITNFSGYKQIKVSVSWDEQGISQIPEEVNTIRSDY